MIEPEQISGGLLLHIKGFPATLDSTTKQKQTLSPDYIINFKNTKQVFFSYLKVRAGNLGTGPLRLL